jgi:hypothetical protein
LLNGVIVKYLIGQSVAKDFSPNGSFGGNAEPRTVGDESVRKGVTGTGASTPKGVPGVTIVDWAWVAESECLEEGDTGGKGDGGRMTLGDL